MPTILPKSTKKVEPVTKENILNSWIMVEHLSEGDIKIKDKTMICFKELKGQNFYEEFLEILDEYKRKKKRRYPNIGLALYFDTFSFGETMDLLRKIYGLSKTEEEIRVGDKFRFAIYLDKDLNLVPANTFFTEAGYIQFEKEIPSVSEFQKYEEDGIQKITQLFEDAGENAELFQRAILDIFVKYKCSVENSYLQVLENIETEANNLHSFFIDDLEAVKEISTDNLDAYLFGRKTGEERFDLDSNPRSKKRDKEIFSKILTPENYPLGRFPSNTEYALSLMQQVAVNLAVGYDNKQIRSVNGPPGTGKTTLLKDVFAELIVQQAELITKLPKKRQMGFDETIYYKNAKVGMVPNDIAERGIVVSSSNNGAVQNIVKELPLSGDIDEKLIKALCEADYFKDLANTLQGEEEDPDKFWGLFSLEGGKSQNMEKILTALQGIVDYFDEYEAEYEENTKAYEDFEREYKKVSRSRQLIAKNMDSSDRPLNMEIDYDDLQLSNPWFDEEYRVAQSNLFIAALRVRKQFLFDNRKNIKAAMIIWKRQEEYVSQGKGYLVSIAWDWMNLAIPVIGSTFASFGRMCSNLGENTLGHLFIDEAGQALPQASVGAIFRSCHVMAVGDPSQIKPVLTLDSKVLALLRTHFKVNEIYLSEDASTQTLIDSTSRYGFYRDGDCDDDSWIGIPLWVHRRCQYPMFTIANEISYNGFMVQGMKKFGKTGWYDIGGKAANKYVKEQGDFLAKLLEEMGKENPAIFDKEKPDQVYVISPFSNVAFELARRLQKINFTRRDQNGKPTNIGTVHTFQGKEAPIVFMVLGADTQSKGAANWAVSEPNMMNVAATRAKKEFYIIGDKKLYADLGSKVITKTAKIIDEYGVEHPELINDNSKQMEEAEEPFVQEKTEPQKTTETSSVLEEEITPILIIPKESRLFGTVSRVGKGKKSSYAYIKGDNGKTYVISEQLYPEISSAPIILKKDNRVSFVVEDEKKNSSVKTKNIYIVNPDIRKED